MRRSASIVLAIVLAGVVGASAFAVCLKSDWPWYKPTQNDFTAETYLSLVILDAQRHIADNHALKATWAEVMAQAIQCRDNVHNHRTRTCNWYWNKCKNAYTHSPDGNNAAYCLSELNHSDPPAAPPPPPAPAAPRR